MEERNESENLYPIGAVSRTTGLSTHVIRAWERRYGAVHPARTEGSHRLYSQQDVRRLSLLRDAVRHGHSIGRLASLPTERLRELVAGSGGLNHQREAPQAPPAGDTRSASAEEQLQACLEAARRLDPRALDEELARSSIAVGKTAVIQDVVAPLMERLGAAWQRGELRVLHEHTATAVVRTFLGTLLSESIVPTPYPAAVAAAPARQSHEIGALSSGVIAAAMGWGVTYLGADTPSEEIVRAAQLARARAVLLSVTMITDEPHLSGELRKLRSFLPPETALILGGAAADALRETASSMHDTFVEDLSSLPVRLRLLHAGPTV